MSGNDELKESKFNQMVIAAKEHLSSDCPLIEDEAIIWAGTIIDELQRDRLRLDWLSDMGNTIGSVLLPTECVLLHSDSMRAAIDMAMTLDNE